MDRRRMENDNAYYYAMAMMMIWRDVRNALRHPLMTAFVGMMGSAIGLATLAHCSTTDEGHPDRFRMCPAKDLSGTLFIAVCLGLIALGVLAFAWVILQVYIDDIKWQEARTARTRARDRTLNEVPSDMTTSTSPVAVEGTSTLGPGTVLAAGTLVPAGTQLPAQLTSARP